MAWPGLGWVHNLAPGGGVVVEVGFERWQLILGATQKIVERIWIKWDELLFHWSPKSIELRGSPRLHLCLFLDLRKHR